MTHLFDTTALLAHYLAENGAERVQALLEDERVVVGVSILSLYEFELRLHHLGLDEPTRAGELDRYRELLDRVVDVHEAVRGEAIRLRTRAIAHISAMDALIGATASLHGATLVHRDPHFSAIPTALLCQELLPAKRTSPPPDCS
ncbi:MAG: PIN domain-containing protein [Verrucomicrobiae bacterium]|nr:PIN domain-containing protein [Verrucomicrobiae bacterium]